MITIQESLAIDALLAAIDVEGLQKRCAYCGQHLPGSDPVGSKVSHGMCEPLCGPARAMGWKEPEEAA